MNCNLARLHRGLGSSWGSCCWTCFWQPSCGRSGTNEVVDLCLEGQELVSS